MSTDQARDHIHIYSAFSGGKARVLSQDVLAHDARAIILLLQSSLAHTVKGFRVITREKEIVYKYSPRQLKDGEHAFALL